MNGPSIPWQAITTLDAATRDHHLITLKVDGRPVLASWHTDPRTGRSFWWNGDVTDDGQIIEICDPTDWALVDLETYRNHYDALIDCRKTAAS